jgi:hypothetical protein
MPHKNHGELGYVSFGLKHVFLGLKVQAQTNTTNLQVFRKMNCRPQIPLWGAFQAYASSQITLDPYTLYSLLILWELYH